MSVTVGRKGRVTIPEPIRRRLDIGEGDVLLTHITPDGTVELVPAEVLPRDQAWFYDRRVQRRVAEAEEDIAAGRTTRVSSKEGAREHLRWLGE